ncbi:MAG: hypothetical protein ABEK50_13815 [bacterium]
MSQYSAGTTDDPSTTLELIGLPRRDGFGNLIAAFDRLEPGDGLLVVDNRDLSWVLKFIRDLRHDQLDAARSHAFQKPENSFLYLVKNED